jgi:hypothetical protein
MTALLERRDVVGMAAIHRRCEIGHCRKRQCEKNKSTPQYVCLLKSNQHRLDVDCWSRNLSNSTILGGRTDTAMEFLWITYRAQHRFRRSRRNRRWLRKLDFGFSIVYLAVPDHGKVIKFQWIRIAKRSSTSTNTTRK